MLKKILFFFITKNIFISLVDGYITISELTSSGKYNANEMPQNSNSERGTKTPLNLIVSMKVSDFRFDYEGDEDLLEVDFKVKVFWYDSRLNYVDRDLQTYIYTKDDTAIWTPPLVWVTERTAKTSVPYTYFRIYPNGLVAEFVSVSIKIRRFHNAGTSDGFSIRLLSLNHTKESLTLQWNETNPVTITKDLIHSGLGFISARNFQPRTCHMTVARLSKKQGGENGCLEISIEERIRKPSSILIVYVPGIALVIISWSCFWMESSIVLGRVAVLLTCLLHLFVQKTSIVKNLLLLKNAMALISFLDGCLGFVLAAFCQTIWITYLDKTTGTSGVTRLSSATTIQEEEEEGIVENSDGEANTECNHFHFPRIWFNRFPSTPDAINAICRVGFPLCFVIFVCAFFAAPN